MKWVNNLSNIRWLDVRDVKPWTDVFKQKLIPEHFGIKHRFTGLINELLSLQSFEAEGASCWIIFSNDPKLFCLYKKCLAVISFKS